MPKIKLGDIPDLDIAELLSDDATRTLFLDDALRSGDAARIADALGFVVRSKSLRRGGEPIGIPGQGRHKARKPDGNPRLSTLLAAVREIGAELRVGVAKSDPAPAEQQGKRET